MKWCKIEYLENLPQSGYEGAMKKLEEKQAKKALTKPLHTPMGTQVDDAS